MYIDFSIYIYKYMRAFHLFEIMHQNKSFIICVRIYALNRG